MKIFKGVSGIPSQFKNAVIAIGVFDGLHLGHQRLITDALRRARRVGQKCVVMTFDPHPVHVLRPENHLPLLISLPQRLELLKSLGVDAVVVVRFTRAFSRLTPLNFIRRYLLKPFAPRVVIVGDDFRFGQDRAGTIDVFQEQSRVLGFEVVAVKTASGGRKLYSSTAAREAIATGDLRGASRILGRPVLLRGKVVRGDGRGKTLGFPTANVIPQNELLPPSGVYVARVRLGRETFGGMVNVGVRPSFHHDERLNVEAHVFDFRHNLYGREIVIEFLHKIRNEMFFPSGEDLVRQLRADEKFSRVWLSRQRFV